MKDKKREKYLCIPDAHIPDHDIKTTSLLLDFIPFYQPDHIFIMGDFMNFTKVSKYDQDPYYNTDLADEIEEGRGVLRDIVSRARKANPDVEMAYLQGNHEARLEKFLGRNAHQLAKLTSDDEYVVSVPHLMELKKLGIKWIPEQRTLEQHNTIFIHGITVRSKGGFSAQANLDKFGSSVVSVHTHRLALVTRTQMGVTKFSIEGGCICSLKPTPSYVVHPDWTQGFSTLTYDHETRQFYPQIIPIINHSFMYEGKLFS